MFKVKVADYNQFGVEKIYVDECPRFDTISELNGGIFIEELKNQILRDSIDINKAFQKYLASGVLLIQSKRVMVPVGYPDVEFCENYKTCLKKEILGLKRLLKRRIKHNAVQSRAIIFLETISFEDNIEIEIIDPSDLVLYPVGFIEEAYRTKASLVTEDDEENNFLGGTYGQLFWLLRHFKVIPKDLSYGESKELFGKLTSFVNIKNYSVESISKRENFKTLLNKNRVSDDSKEALIELLTDILSLIYDYSGLLHKARIASKIRTILNESSIDAASTKPDIKS